MKAISIAFVVAKIGATGLEFLTSPRSPLVARCNGRRTVTGRGICRRVCFFLAVSCRPAFAAAGTIVFTAGLIALSRAKLAFIRVPLGFAHLAFSADSFRQPKGFYTNFLTPLFLATVGILGTIVAAWFYFEPHRLPKAGRAAAGLDVGASRVALARLLPSLGLAGRRPGAADPVLEGAGPAGASVLPCRPPTCGLTGYCSRESAKGAAVGRAAATATASPGE